MASRNQVIREKIGKRIQKIRKSLGYSQEELAHIVGISRTHMGHLEQGRRSPSIEVLGKIAKKLKIPAGNLME